MNWRENSVRFDMVNTLYESKEALINGDYIQ